MLYFCFHALNAALTLSLGFVLTGVFALSMCSLSLHPPCPLLNALRSLDSYLTPVWSPRFSRIWVGTRSPSLA